MASKKSTRRMNSGNLSLTASSSFGDYDSHPASSRDIVMMESGGLGSGTNASGSTGKNINNTNSSSNGPSSSRRNNTRRDSKGKDNSNKFNPRMIFSQIVSLQCFHYVILGVLFQANFLFFGRSITVDRIFTDEYIKMWSAKGLPDTFAVLVSSVAGYVKYYCLSFGCHVY